MALMDVKATVYLGGVRSLFSRLAHIDTRKVFTGLKGPATFDLRHHWRKDEAPWGHWPGLAASTLERRTRPRGIDRKRGKRRSWPKRLLGRFPTAIKHIVSSGGQSAVQSHCAGIYGGPRVSVKGNLGSSPVRLSFGWTCGTLESVRADIRALQRDPLGG